MHLMRNIYRKTLGLSCPTFIIYESIPEINFFKDKVFISCCILCFSGAYKFCGGLDRGINFHGGTEVQAGGRRWGIGFT